MAGSWVLLRQTMELLADWLHLHGQTHCSVTMVIIHTSQSPFVALSIVLCVLHNIYLLSVSDQWETCEHTILEKSYFLEFNNVIKQLETLRQVKMYSQLSVVWSVCCPQTCRYPWHLCTKPHGLCLNVCHTSLGCIKLLPHCRFLVFFVSCFDCCHKPIHCAKVFSVQGDYTTKLTSASLKNLPQQFHTRAEFRNMDRLHCFSMILHPLLHLIFANCVLFSLVCLLLWNMFFPLL